LATLELNNYATKSRARVKGNKDTPVEEFTRLLSKARETLKSTGNTSTLANLSGVVVELITNSDHQRAFWQNNWWPGADGVLPHARIYSVRDVPGLEPAAYYCPPLSTALFVNTEYYGQCKSWALGMAAAILERRFNTLSIHGATAMYKGRGVVIIAPTGTGKTTQSFKLFQLPEGKICGDDWAYVTFPTGPDGGSAPLVAKQPERSLYMRSESQKEQEWLRGVFDKSLNENITTQKTDCDYTKGEDGCALTGKKCVFDQGMNWCYYSFGNSRALVRREDLLGGQKVVDSVPVNLVVLLRRDDKSPAEVRLSPSEAIDVLRKGEYMVLPGAGPKEKWGTISNEPWYNPYLLELDARKQEEFFGRMFSDWKVPCMILNTGVEGIDQTHKRILAALESAG
jgi:hypothetical protein